MFRQGAYAGLVQNISAKEFQSFSKPISSNRIEIIADTVFKNTTFKKGDMLRLEECSFHNIMKTADVLKQKLENNSSITKVALKEDFKYMYDQTSKSLSSIIIMMVVFSCALALVINYNLILINIHTRTREIATLKVLGYQEFEVSGYVFRETFIISLAAILIGILLGKTLHFSIISIIDVDGVILANEIKSLSYILTFILSLVFLGIEYFLSLPQTRKINMIEALKSYE